MERLHRNTTPKPGQGEVVPPASQIFPRHTGECVNYKFCVTAACPQSVTVFTCNLQFLPHHSLSAHPEVFLSFSQLTVFAG